MKQNNFYRFMVTLFAMLTLSLTSVWGAEVQYYSYTFAAKQFADNASAKTLGSLSWTPSTTWSAGSGYWGYDGTKGQQWGSGSTTLNVLTLTTSTSVSNVSSVVVSASIANSGGCSLSVTVGTTAFQCDSKESVALTTTNKAYTFTSETPVSGAVTITMSNGSKKKAQYIKTITINQPAAEVTLSAGENGAIEAYSDASYDSGKKLTIKSNKVTVAKNSQIFLLAVANSGYEVDQWSSSDFELTAGADATKKSVVASKDGAVSVSFKAAVTTGYKVTLNQSTGGTISADKVINLAQGDEVTLSYELTAGYNFSEWTVLDDEAQEVTVTDNKFNMPASDVEVEATFTPIAVTNVSLNKQTTSIEVGAYETLIASVLPEDALDKTIIWESSATSVATVDDEGKVVAIGDGEATITATSYDNPDAFATCVVTVTKAVKWEKVSSAPLDWAGEYMLVYEEGTPTPTTAKVWTGVDVANSCVSATITNGQITKPVDAVTITLASMEGGYSIKVNGGTNNGKYIYGTSGSNKTNFGADAVANTIAYDGGNVSITSNTSVMRFNNATSSGQWFRYYKSASYSSQKAVQLYKKSNGKENVATPTFSVEAGSYLETKTVEIATTTSGASIYYTLDGTDPTSTSTLYEAAIVVSSTTTIKAIAVKDGMNDSQIATATYTIDVYASLADLVKAGAPTSTAKNVKVTLTNDVIAALDGTQGVYIDVEYGAEQPQRIELYKTSLPSDWVVGGKLSGTITCPWKLYKTTWELCPTSWDDLTYTAPTGTTEVVIEGTPTKTAYIDGEKFDPTGITVTATISGVPTVVTEGITWTPATLTLGTTSIDIQATYNSVASNVLEDVAVTVSEIPTKTIDDFISVGGGRCYLIGDVSGAATNGFTLTDATRSIYIYKYTLAAGVEDVDDGDYIKILAEEYEYYQSKTHEAKNVEVVEHLTKPEVHVTSVNISAATAEVKVGKTVTLTASVLPANADNKNIIWSTSDATKATVNGGVVTGVAAGDVTITATSEDNSEAFASCAVTVLASTLPEFDKGDWVEVTKASELVAGSYVIVAAAESNYAMKSYVSGNNLPFKACTKTGDMLTYDADFAVFELQDYTDGGLSFFDVAKEKYLYSPSTSNYLKAQDSQDQNASWTISIDEDGLTIFNKKNTAMEIQKNSTSHNFSCYKSTQDAVTLYKYYTKADKIFYDANGGEDAPASSRANALGVATVTEDVPTYGGYSFVNWTENQDGTGKVYAAGEEVTMSGDITIFAQWEKKPIEGTPVVIAFKYGEKFFAMNQSCEPKEINVFNGKVLNMEEEDKEKFIWYCQGSGTTATFQNASEKYLKGVTGKTDLTLEDVACTWTWDSENSCYSIGSRTFFYQESSNAIKNYAKSNLNIQGYSGAAMFLTEFITGTPVTVRESLTIGKLGTLCMQYGVDAGMFEGAEAYKIAYKDGNVKNLILESVDVLEAGATYIVSYTAETLRCIYNGESVTTPKTAADTRGLTGTFTGTSFTGTENQYVIKDNKIYKAGNVTIGANKGWIEMDEVDKEESAAPQRPGSRRITLGTDDVTLLNMIGETQVDGLRKVVVNGQLIIIRDGKKFNAQGAQL